MVTCCLKKCRKRTNLDEDGYCPDHSSLNTQSENCGKCGQDVPNDSSSKALQCESESCKVWFHLHCTAIPESLYDLINDVSEDEDAGIRWLCPSCRGNGAVQFDKETEVVQVECEQKPICNKLKHGKCVHGITGKTKVQGKVCEYSHPKFCKKFTKYGNRGRYGCKKERCELFHPILCQNSTKFKKCLNTKCTYQHLNGTARKDYKNTQDFPPIQSIYPYANHRHDQDVWQSKHHLRQATQPQRSLAAKNQSSARTYYNNSSVTPGSSFLSPPQPQSHPPELASLQLQVNKLEGLIKKVLDMSLQQQHYNLPPHPLNYQNIPQHLQKC